MKRRDVIKGLTLLPIAGGVTSTAESVFAASGVSNSKWLADMETRGAVPGPLTPGPQIYQSIGVEPIINCVGTFTILGASIEPPEVRAAMESASNSNVQIDELAFGVGQRLAELTGAEWGMVSSGCAGSMNEFTAGVLAGGNPEKLIRIPNLEGFEKTEVIIPSGSRSVYDHAIRNCGVKIISPSTLEQFKNALGPKTAMVYMMAGRPGNTDPNALTLENVSKLTKAMNPPVPILVDAAAEGLSLKPNIHLAAGATAVSYSGGKCIRGPQCSGLLLGEKKYLMAAWQASSPHHGPCRDNKVGREEFLGLLAAVELWAATDHAKEIKMWVGWLDNIAKKVSGIESVTTSIREPATIVADNPTPTLTISWNPDVLKITGREVIDELSSTKPRIALGGGGGGGRGRGGAAAAAPATPTTSISIAAYQMGPGNDKIVADRVYEILSRKRSAAKAAVVMKAPAANITGRWQVAIDYYTSKSVHTFIIENQDGNWLQGTHNGEFGASRPLFGTIDGNVVKFQSNIRPAGDSVTMTFQGTLSGDTITGDIDMIEYINARFVATKATYPSRRTPIDYPVGRPLST